MLLLSRARAYADIQPIAGIAADVDHGREIEASMPCEMREE